MLCYQAYNVQSPLNAKAAVWTQENITRLPLLRSEPERRPVTARDATRASVGQRLRGLALGLAFLLCLPAASLIIGNWPDSSITVCFFRTITGIRCPLCGLTHAFAAAWEGRWSAAWVHHPLWWLFAAIWIAVGLLLLVGAARGTLLLREVRERMPRWLTWAFLAAVAVVWVVRLAW